jgi:hypothetical protein
MDPDVIDALWEQIEPTVFISRAEFVAGLDGWDIRAEHVDGELAFVTMTNGPEFHFATFGTRAPITRSRTRAWIDPIIARHGFVTTRTPKEGADRQHRFNLTFGFRPVDEDEFHIMYRMDHKCR